MIHEGLEHFCTRLAGVRHQGLFFWLASGTVSIGQRKLCHSAQATAVYDCCRCVLCCLAASRCHTSVCVHRSSTDALRPAPLAASTAHGTMQRCSHCMAAALVLIPRCSWTSPCRWAGSRPQLPGWRWGWTKCRRPAVGAGRGRGGAGREEDHEGAWVAECRLLCKQGALLSCGAHASKLSPRPGAPLLTAMSPEATAAESS